MQIVFPHVLLKCQHRPTEISRSYFERKLSVLPASLCQRSPSLMQGCCRQPAAPENTRLIYPGYSNRSGRWWPSRGSAWPTRNTARTSRREETWPRRWWAANWQRDASMTLAQIGDVHSGMDTAAWWWLWWWWWWWWWSASCSSHICHTPLRHRVVLGDTASDRCQLLNIMYSDSLPPSAE